MAGFEDFASSPGFQFGYPLAAALTAALLPNRGARAVSALNTGLGIANAYSQQQKKEQDDKLLAQKLGDFMKSTTPVQSQQTVAEMPVNPKEATFSMPSPEDTQAPPLQSVPLGKQTVTTQKPMFSPQMQKLGDVYTAANRPDALLQAITSQLMKPPPRPLVAGSAETGYSAINPETLQPTQVIPGVGRREPTPPRPVFGTQGGEGVSSVYNPDTKKWEVQRTPLTAAPARLLSPQEEALKNAETNLAIKRQGLVGAQTVEAGARTGEVNQRTQRIKALTNAVNDPKTTQEKLGTLHGEIIRAIKQTQDDFEMPEDQRQERLTNLRSIAQDAEAKMADRIRGGQGGQPTQQAAAPQTPPGKPIGKTKDGKIVYQDDKGKKYVAN